MRTNIIVNFSPINGFFPNTTTVHFTLTEKIITVKFHQQLNLHQTVSKLTAPFFLN